MADSYESPVIGIRLSEREAELDGISIRTHEQPTGPGPEVHIHGVGCLVYHLRACYFT